MWIFSEIAKNVSIFQVTTAKKNIFFQKGSSGACKVSPVKRKPFVSAAARAGGPNEHFEYTSPLIR